jgi:hypothetical protein
LVQAQKVQSELYKFGRVATLSVKEQESALEITQNCIHQTLSLMWIRFGARSVLILVLLIVLSLANNPVLADEQNNGYQLGRGYALGNSSIHLGGYGGTEIEGLGSTPWSFNVNDLSLFVSWDNGSRLRFFSETEVENLVSAGEHQSLTTSKANFRLERIYFDYLVNDNLTVRLGKVLTPIGQWNLIHADPLVWTSTRPVATDNLFAEHATGIMLHGTVPLGEQSLDYSAYGDYSSSLDPRLTETPAFDNALGVRLRYNFNDNLKIGFSYADFALQDNRHIRNHLTGLDIAWTFQRFAVNSEIVYRSNDFRQNHNAWQGYIQGVSPLLGHLYAVGRYEFFDQANQQMGQVGVFGLAFRPKPPLVWKLEYRLGQHNRELAPDGLFASFSVLF